MESVNRQDTRMSNVSSASNATGGLKKTSSRPSLLSKARDNYRESRANVKSKSTSAATAKANGEKGVDLHSFAGVFPVPEAECSTGKPPKLNEEQEGKYTDMLDYFKSQKDFPVSLAHDNTKREAPSDWEKLRLLSRESLLRYLRASKWDTKVAKKRLTETIAWMREFGVNDLDEDEMSIEAKSGKETVLGYDLQSRPLHYMNPHRSDTKVRYYRAR
jgi:hypothetical protein